MKTQMEIDIVGLGPGSADLLSLKALDLMKQSPRVFLRTRVHPVVEWLEKEGVTYSSFDHLYEQLPSFREVYAKICEEILAAGATEPVVYAVPGHPLVYEASVGLILEAAKGQGINVRVHPAVSFLDALLVSLELAPRQGLQVVDGLSLNRQEISVGDPVIVTQVYNQLVAGEVKITLLEIYPPEHEIAVVQAAGVPDRERIERLPLRKLDRLDWLDHLTSVYLPPKDRHQLNCSPESGAGQISEEEYGAGLAINRLVSLMACLRSPEGCPWDREQDHLSLRPFLLEETYEVLEALQDEDRSKLCEELGDLLLQIVFHTQIASEEGGFDLNDVINGISEKIIRRHPHVFGEVSVRDSSEVNRNWEIIKAKEKGNQPTGLLLDSVSWNLSPLMLGMKLQKKAATVGFDWPDHRGALAKVHEELEELTAALREGDLSQMEKETGDVLFSMINLARLLKIDPEVVLLGTCVKFRKRFNYIEKKAQENRQKLEECSLQQLDRWWEEAKTLEI